MDNHYINPNPASSKVLNSLGIILRLIGFILVGNVLAILLFIAVSGISMGNIQETISNPTSDSKGLLLAIQGLSQLFMFIILPLIYVHLFNKSLYSKILVKPENIGVYSLLAIFIVFSSIPLISWLSEWNKSLDLPEFMKGFQAWAESKEQSAKRLTELIVYYTTTSEFFIALLVIAVIPAIGEELMFRGIVQNEFSSVFKNPHIAIWITGFIFSFIHFQFLGFFPRMLLGVTFGYLYYWSGNLIIPILVHFLNNAMTLIAMNLYKQKIIDMDPESAESIPLISIIISLLIFSFLLFTFKRFKNSKTGETDENF